MDSCTSLSGLLRAPALLVSLARETCCCVVILGRTALGRHLNRKCLLLSKPLSPGVSWGSRSGQQW